jgi:hypothetical protein
MLATRNGRQCRVDGQGGKGRAGHPLRKLTGHCRAERAHSKLEGWGTSGGHDTMIGREWHRLTERYNCRSESVWLCIGWPADPLDTYWDNTQRRAARWRRATGRPADPPPSRTPSRNCRLSRSLNRWRTSLWPCRRLRAYVAPPTTASVRVQRVGGRVGRRPIPKGRAAPFRRPDAAGRLVGCGGLSAHRRHAGCQKRQHALDQDRDYSAHNFWGRARSSAEGVTRRAEVG